MSGPGLAGRVSFLPFEAGCTCVGLSVDFDPFTPLGHVADTLGVPDWAIERVLARFHESKLVGTVDAGRAGGPPGVLGRAR
jgi:hypothetical protein